MTICGAAGDSGDSGDAGDYGDDGDSGDDGDIGNSKVSRIRGRNRNELTVVDYSTAVFGSEAGRRQMVDDDGTKRVRKREQDGIDVEGKKNRPHHTKSQARFEMKFDSSHDGLLYLMVQGPLLLQAAHLLTSAPIQLRLPSWLDPNS